MFEYDPAAKAAAEYLDTYDFSKLLSDCYDNGWRDPWEIREKIIQDHPEAEGALEDLSTDEFMEYLYRNYYVRFEEVISYRMWYNPLYGK